MPRRIQYYDENDANSVFDDLVGDGDLWNFHLKGRQAITASVVANHTYEVDLTVVGEKEIRMLLKGGIPLVILRHAIYDLRDKQGHCYLKSVDEKKRSWKRSSHFRGVNTQPE